MNEHAMLTDMADDLYIAGTESMLVDNRGAPLQPELTADRVAAEELGAWREEETLKRLGYCVNAGANIEDVSWLAAELGLSEEWRRYIKGE